MNERIAASHAKSLQSTAWARSLGWVLLGLCVLVLVTAVILPAQTLAWLRSDYRLLGQPLNWLETISPAIDLEHVLLFCGIGILLRMLRPRMPWALFAAWMAALAAGSEVVQFLVPGRTPRLIDVRDDLLGALLGSVLAIGGGWLLRGRG